MKEAIGGAWLYTLVITMIVLFTTFVSVTTNYTRSYKIKDQLISIIEKNGGVSKKTLKQINDHLREIGYTTTGKCPEGGSSQTSENWYGFLYSDDNGPTTRDNVNYCIYKHVISCRVKSKDGNVVTFSGKTGYNTIPRAYYGVTAFFKLDWPILRQVIHLDLTGETSVIYLYNTNTEIEVFNQADICTG